LHFFELILRSFTPVFADFPFIPTLSVFYLSICRFFSLEVRTFPDGPFRPKPGWLRQLHWEFARPKKVQWVFFCLISRAAKKKALKILSGILKILSEKLGLLCSYSKIGEKARAFFSGG
jgi:hypothetical protein